MKVFSNQIDWSTFGNNIKRQKSTSGSSPANGANTNLGGNGCQITLTVDQACVAFVVVAVGCRSTSDFEHKPQVWLNGAIHTISDVGASASGGAGNRAIQRTVLAAVPLSVGSHTLSAGIFVSSSTSASVNAGEAEIMAIVLGRVTA